MNNGNEKIIIKSLVLLYLLMLATCVSVLGQEVKKNPQEMKKRIQKKIKESIENSTSWKSFDGKYHADKDSLYYKHDTIIFFNDCNGGSGDYHEWEFKNMKNFILSRITSDDPSISLNISVTTQTYSKIFKLKLRITNKKLYLIKKSNTYRGENEKFLVLDFKEELCNHKGKTDVLILKRIYGKMEN